MLASITASLPGCRGHPQADIHELRCPAGVSRDHDTLVPFVHREATLSLSLASLRHVLFPESRINLVTYSSEAPPGREILTGQGL